MASIVIRHEHALGAAEAAARLKLLAGDLGRRYGLRIDFRGGVAVFEGSGVSGSATVSEKAVEVEASLPFFLPQELVEGGVREALAKHFG